MVHICTRTPKRQLCGYGAGLVLCACILCFTYKHVFDFSLAISSSRNSQEKSKERLEGDGHGYSDSETEYTHFNTSSTCVALLPPDTQMPKDVAVNSKPMWIASFPGSGAELFRDLITSITGQPTVDGTMKGKCQAGKGTVVTCKTHWPTISTSGSNSNSQYQDPLVTVKDANKNYHTTAMVLIRNPAMAIPSWYNQIWESRVQADFHSQQAPEANWNRFRSHPREIQKRLQQWKHLILNWAYSDQYDTQLFVPFESLVDAVEGPIVLRRVVDVLHSAEIPLLVSPSAASTTTTTTTPIDCFWKETVRSTAGMKRSAHKYQPSFTEVQRKYMIALMDELMASELGVDHPELLPVLQGYRLYMKDKLRIAD